MPRASRDIASSTVLRTLVTIRSIIVDRMFVALLACMTLAACDEHDQPSSSAQLALPSASSHADAPALTGTSDIQRWALQQTQPSLAPSDTLQQNTTQDTPASDALLPPVIHTAE
jgi:hypothetical protein